MTDGDIRGDIINYIYASAKLFPPKTTNFANGKISIMAQRFSTNSLILVLRLQALKVKKDSARCQRP